MRRRADDRQAGFALAESIAVLALSALVLLTLLIATNLVSRNSAAAARQANDLEMLATGLAAIRADLESALFVPVSDDRNSPPLFSGGADSVGLALASDGSRRDGESLIWIEARYGDGEGVLVRSSAPLLPGATSFQGARFGDTAMLARGPWQYVFSYADGSGEELRWSDAWGTSSRMPVAIRLEVKDTRGRRVVPALTARVRIDAGLCDLNEEACREDDTLESPSVAEDEDAPIVPQ